MPASLNRSDAAYNEFDAGTASQINPLSARDLELVRFSARKFRDTAKRDSAISQKFGISSVDYFRKLESVKDHPHLSKRVRSRVGELFSTPGPMTGGAPIMDSKQFSHGVNW